MGTQQHASKTTQAVSPASSAKLLQTRPFQNEHETESQQPSELQTAESATTSHSFDLTTKTFSATEPATAAPAALSLGLPLQAKLTIGEPNDKYEQEADRVAQDVVQRINAPDAPSSPQDRHNQATSNTTSRQPSLQNQAQRQAAPKTAVSGFDLTTRTFAIAPQPTAAPRPLLQPKLVPNESALQRETEEEDELQMKPLQRQTVSGGTASNELESTINRARGSGQSLHPKLQQSMGQAMGADFSRVKVHTDSTADTLNKSIQAKAFTTGKDVFFRSGEYSPETKSGQELIAHELTHVVQQGNANIQRSVHDEDGVEQDLDEVIEYLTNNGVEKPIAQKLADEYVNGQAAAFRSDLLQIALSSSDKQGFDNMDVQEQSMLMDKAKNMVQQGDDWWLDKLNHYNFLTYEKDPSVLAYLATQVTQKENEYISYETALQKGEEKKTIGMDKKEIIATFNQFKQKTSPAQKICDLVARLLMVEAVGATAYDDLITTYEKTFVKKKGGNPKQKANSITTDNGGWAGSYGTGKHQEFSAAMSQWTQEESRGVLQVKFAGGGGQHTFVLERLGTGQFLMYQAYEGAISLSDFLNSQDNNPLGQGKAITAQDIAKKIIEPMATALSTGTNKTGISPEIYTQVFGAKKDHAVYVKEIALIGFNLGNIQQSSNDQGLGKVGFLELNE